MKKKSYLQNLVDTMRADAYNHVHLSYGKRPRHDPMDAKLSRYYRRAHGHKTLFIDLGELGVVDNVKCPAYYGKRKRALAWSYGLAPRKRVPFPRRGVVTAKNQNVLYMRLRGMFGIYVPVTPDVSIEKWDRVEFIYERDAVVLQVYVGAQAPTYVHFIRKPEKMTGEEELASWKNFEYYDYINNGMRQLSVKHRNRNLLMK